MSFNASVDLQRALEVLVEKQHLNQAHFAVGLIRKLLLHGARHIDVVTKRRSFSVSFDGDSIAQDEVDHLRTVLDKSVNFSERLHALSCLETKYDLTLLTLCMTNPGLEVRGPVSFAVEKERINALPSSTGRTKIFFQRRKGKPKEETLEIAFYCNGARASLTVNGRALQSELPFLSTDALLYLRNENSEVWIGWPRPATCGQLRYFKHGVYFGLAKRPRWPLPIEIRFNSLLHDVEDNFRESIALAKTAEADLLQHAVDFVAEATKRPSEKTGTTWRAPYLLEIPPSFFSKSCAEAPLFTTSAGPISLQDAVANADHGRVQCSTANFHPRPHVLLLPLAKLAQVAPFFADRGAHLRRVLQPISSIPRRKFLKHTALSATHPDKRKSTDGEVEVLHALNVFSAATLVLLDDDVEHAFLAANSNKVGIPRTHSSWLRAQWAFANAPHELPILAADLSWPPNNNT
ncbi:MAG: hypothetical protein GY822_07800 [Deltaproteobacteria bacterium]|nr:hypothetical protein [Deltaproteobacteria bacterium]